MAIDLWTQQKITILEIFIIIFFSIALIFTNDGKISLFLSIIFLAFLICCDKLARLKYFKKLEKINNTFIIWAYMMFLIDLILTFLSVQHFKVATENNQFLVYIWNYQGYIFGQFFIFYVFTISFLLIYVLNNKIKIPIINFFSFITLCIFMVSYTIAILNNIYQLFPFI